MNEHTDTVMVRLADACEAVGQRPDWAFWQLQELRFERRDAQAVAEQAYAHWCVERTAESYCVYRAAQDRADAAQDELAAAVAERADPYS